MPNIIIQRIDRKSFVPKAKELRTIAQFVLQQFKSDLALTIRIVSKKEMHALNLRYREKDSATNVLSFHYDDAYGDVVICAAIVNEEAAIKQISSIAHYAHMVIHGLLHLQGFDHENDADAQKMQTLEIKLLAHFGFNNPYIIGNKYDE